MSSRAKVQPNPPMKRGSTQVTQLFTTDQSGRASDEDYTSSEESEPETKGWFSMSRKVGVKPNTQTTHSVSTATWDPYAKFRWKEETSASSWDESEEESPWSKELDHHHTKSSSSFGKDARRWAPRPMHLTPSAPFETTRDRLRDRKASEMEETVWRPNRPNPQAPEQVVKEMSRAPQVDRFPIPQFEATRDRLRERKAGEMEENVWRPKRPNQAIFEQMVRGRQIACTEEL
jgi:hypothetical protein